MVLPIRSPSARPRTLTDYFLFPGRRPSTGSIFYAAIPRGRNRSSSRGPSRSETYHDAYNTELTVSFGRLHANVLKQWDIMEKRLGKPDQLYVALKDRPTIADLSYFPFAMPWMFGFLGVDIKDWPHIQAWSKRMLERPAVRKVMQEAPKYGQV